MAGSRMSGYSALGQRSGRGRPWWQRFPKPLEWAALHAWGRLPRFVGVPLVPLGRLFGPHSSTGRILPGADAAPGVVDLISQGFEPIETQTGAIWVAALWPDEHRRSVAETRPWWLDDPESDGRVWLIRSPWASLTLTEVFEVLWRWVERDRTLDEQIRRKRVAEVLAWPESRAVEQLRTP